MASFSEDGIFGLSPNSMYMNPYADFNVMHPKGNVQEDLQVESLQSNTEKNALEFVGNLSRGNHYAKCQMVNYDYLRFYHLRMEVEWPFSRQFTTQRENVLF